jgi:hypothetical protein
MFSIYIFKSFSTYLLKGREEEGWKKEGRKEGGRKSER